MNKSNKWLCLSCNKNTKYEHFYLKDNIWFKVHNSKKGMLCINCIEAKLNRRLCKQDFTNCYINKLSYGNKSIELVKRLSI